MSPKTHPRVLRGSFRAGSGVSNPVARTDVLEAGQSGTFLGNSEWVETEAGVQFASQAVPPKPEQPRAAPESRCGPGAGWRGWVKASHQGGCALRNTSYSGKRSVRWEERAPVPPQLRGWGQGRRRRAPDLPRPSASSFSPDSTHTLPAASPQSPAPGKRGCTSAATQDHPPNTHTDPRWETRPP